MTVEAKNNKQYPEKCLCGAGMVGGDTYNSGPRYDSGDIEQVSYRRYSCGSIYLHRFMLYNGEPFDSGWEIHCDKGASKLIHPCQPDDIVGVHQSDLRYYHRPDSGMLGLVTKLRKDAEKLGLTACPYCYEEKADSVESAYRKHIDEAERKAWDSLSRYKFTMFGYWAAIWIHLNHISGLKLPNPWKELVVTAKQHQVSNKALNAVTATRGIWEGLPDDDITGEETE